MENLRKKYPDAKKHQVVSFTKSVIRIVGYALLLSSVEIAVAVLIASEALGVFEELV